MCHSVGMLSHSRVGYARQLSVCLTFCSRALRGASSLGGSAGTLTTTSTHRLLRPTTSYSFSLLAEPPLGLSCAGKAQRATWRWLGFCWAVEVF